VELVAGVLGWDGDVEWLTQQVRPGEVDRLDSETTPLLTLALGWEPTTGLEDGVALTARKWGWGG
jgi:nucleoside-diphosphate-sugar epimerase